MCNYFLRGLMMTIWLLAVLLAAPGQAAQKTLLVLGDSLSASYGLAQERGWVSLLQQRLTHEKSPYRVVNASISGETTSGGLYRIDALLANHRPAIVVLELGANDGLRGLSLEATRGNLENMIQRSKQSGAKVLLIGMRIPPNYGPSYAEPFHEIFETLAKKYRIPRVPFLLAPIAGKREYFQADGLHPTAEAQVLMLDTVWPVLQPLLRK